MEELRKNTSRKMENIRCEVMEVKRSVKPKSARENSRKMKEIVKFWLKEVVEIDGELVFENKI